MRNDPAWPLFVDWCMATGNTALPASPASVLVFLADCPASPRSMSDRVAAIDAAHAERGLSGPGTAAEVQAALRVARGLPPRPDLAPRFDRARVAAGLEAALVTGWPYGLVGRRDAALAVAVCVLEMSRPRAVQLTLGDVAEVRPEDRTRLNGGGPVALAGRAVFRGPAPGSCPACAVVRWQRAVAFYARRGRDKVRRDMWGSFPAPARDKGRHACVNLPGRVLQALPERAASEPLFTSIDRNGWLGSDPLTIRSVTPIVVAVLADGAVRAEERPAAELGSPRRRAAGNRTPIDHAEAVRRRNAALAEMETVDRVLDALDAEADAAIAASQRAIDAASGQLARLDELSRWRTSGETAVTSTVTSTGVPRTAPCPLV